MKTEVCDLSRVIRTLFQDKHKAVVLIKWLRLQEVRAKVKIRVRVETP